MQFSLKIHFFSAFFVYFWLFSAFFLYLCSRKEKTTHSIGLNNYARPNNHARSGASVQLAPRNGDTQRNARQFL